MRMKKGFTLMEVLAVILIVAVVSSMAVPALRALRADLKNSQARAATLRLVEATKNYYRDNKKLPADGCFSPLDTDTIIKTAPASCATAKSTGIPPSRDGSGGTTDSNGLANLFACGYLAYKDFVGLPYKFCNYKPSDLPTENPTGYTEPFYAVAYGYSAAKAGDKYKKEKGYIYVDGRMKVKDTYGD